MGAPARPAGRRPRATLARLGPTFRPRLPAFLRRQRRAPRLRPFDHLPFQLPQRLRSRPGGKLHRPRPRPASPALHAESRILPLAPDLPRAGHAGPGLHRPFRENHRAILRAGFALLGRQGLHAAPAAARTRVLDRAGAAAARGTPGRFRAPDADRRACHAQHAGRRSPDPQRRLHGRQHAAPLRRLEVEQAQLPHRRALRVCVSGNHKFLLRLRAHAADRRRPPLRPAFDRRGGNGRRAPRLQLQPRLQDRAGEHRRRDLRLLARRLAPPRASRRAAATRCLPPRRVRVAADGSARAAFRSRPGAVGLVRRPTRLRAAGPARRHVAGMGCPPRRRLRAPPRRRAVARRARAPQRTRACRREARPRRVDVVRAQSRRSRAVAGRQRRGRPLVPRPSAPWQMGNRPLGAARAAGPIVSLPPP